MNITHETTVSVPELALYHSSADQNIKKFSMRTEGARRPEYTAADKEARLSLSFSYYNTFSISVEVM